MSSRDKTTPTSMDETFMVKGCLGSLPCGRFGKSGKSSGKKAEATAATKGPKPALACSPQKPFAKPSAAILPSPRRILPTSLQVTDEELKKPTTAITSSKPYRQDAIKGQLQLGFYVDGQVILVQVFEAKNLKFRSPFVPGKEGCFVAVELVSKSEENKRQTTAVVCDASPIFNEEFVLRMKHGANYHSARLVISLYKTSSPKGCEEMIGCMSFGVTGLQDKCTSNTDTYYLLNRALGMKKHLRTSQEKHLNLLANMSGVSSLSSLMNRQTTSLLLRSGIQGQQQQQPDLHHGQRQQTRFRNVSEFTVPDRSSVVDETDYGYSAIPSDSMFSYQMAVGSNHYSKKRLNTIMLSTPRLDAVSTIGKSSSDPSDLYRMTSDLDTCSLSSISLCNLSSSPCQASFNKFRIIYGTDEDSGPQEYYGSDVSSYSPENYISPHVYPSGTSVKLSDSNYDTSVTENSSTKPAQGSSSSSLKISHLIDASASSSGVSSNANSSSLQQHQHHLPSKEKMSKVDEVDEVCLQLIHLEDQFVALMHQGVLRFSRPLRHGILTAFEHQALFQNVEKIRLISEFILKKLADCWAKNQSGLQALGDIYDGQLQMICDAYKTYFNGLPASDQVLGELLRKPAFVDFLRKDLPGIPNIRLDTFLQAPQNHMENLISVFQDLILKAASPAVLKVQRELRICWNQRPRQEINKERRHPDADVSDNLFESYISSEFNKVEQQRDHTQICNISPDLLQVEEKLQFSAGVKPFNFAIPGRYIIFAGEVEFIINWKWVKTSVFLTNDVMMVTQKEADGHLTVISEPIYLRDILTTQFDCKHPCEILLTVKSESRDTAWSHMRTATFRTATEGEKETWARLVTKCITNISNERRTSL